MPITVHDIAKKVNLSHTTVSRALNDRSSIHIPADTRSRIRLVAEEMGYRPNYGACALVTGRTHLIALQLYRMNSPYCAEVAHTLQSLAWQGGYEVLVHEFDGNLDRPQSVIDGVLTPDQTFWAESRKGIPHVSMGAFATDKMDHIGIDLYHSSREAIELFVSTGRSQIVFVGRRDAEFDARDLRLRAYRDVMAEAGLPEKFIVTKADTRREGKSSILAFMQQGHVADALFCVNDELSAGCYSALAAFGKRIPDGVAVIGCDGIEEGKYLTPPLTTIIPPIEDMCNYAWNALRDRIENASVESKIVVLPTRLEIRAST